MFRAYFRYLISCPRLIGGPIPPILDRMQGILGWMHREIAKINKVAEAFSLGVARAFFECQCSS